MLWRGEELIRKKESVGRGKGKGECKYGKGKGRVKVGERKKDRIGLRKGGTGKERR